MTPRDHKDEGRLSRFSLDRRITVLVLFMSALVVGAMATFRIPVELIPSGFTAPFMAVSVPWRDAPSKEVLDKVSVPLEEELNTVRGIDAVTSVSETGRSRVYLRFKQGVDMDVAYREVRDRVERAKSQFPDDIDQVYIRKEDAAAIPIFILGVAIDPDLIDSYNLIQNEIIMPLSRVDGVASVNADGLVEKEILIELDRDRTNAAGLNIYDLASELGSDNFTLASGTVRDSNRKLLLRSVARFDNLEALQNRLVGGTTRLRDIAKVTYEQPEKDFRVRAMSKPAVAVVVLKEGDANVREVTEKLAVLSEDIKANPRLGNTEMIVIFSQGDVIDEALRTLLGSGLIGGGIAFLVLFFFLRRFRLTTIIALGIPLSLLIGLTVMYFAGESLNLLTLLGLMLCVGLLVDNSVVVAENIHRLYRGGMRRRDACIHGAGEVALAITMSTLTTIVVFLPVSLVEGPGQFFLLRLAIPVCVSVAASLMVALIFIPLCVFLTLGSEIYQPSTSKSLPDRAKRSLGWLYEHTLERVNNSYGRLLELFLRKRVYLGLTCLLLFGTVIGIFQSEAVGFTGSQEDEQQGFSFEIEMPSNSTLEETEAWFLQAESVVQNHAEELDLDGWFLYHEETYGELQGWFKSPRTKRISPKQVSERVKEMLPVKPGMKLYMGGNEEAADDSDASVFPVILHGEDPELLEQVADELETMLLKFEGVTGIKGSADQTPNELALVVDRESAQRFGVNPQAVAGVVGYALRGTPLPKFRTDGKEIPVRVRFREQDRESLAELADFMVPAGEQGFLPLSSLTETRFLDAPRYIVRRDARVSETVLLELAEDGQRETRQRLQALLPTLDLPEGVSFGADTQQRNLDDDLDGMKFAFILSVIFIYLLMGFLFESFILPLSIIPTIPLSLIGVAWIHLFTGYDIDFLGVVAMILLVGVVVNNGIVLIDYVNRLRQEGMHRTEALITASHRRFRPIMMTAITTVGGMVPLAFAGANSIGLSYTSFSLTLIGGMLTATMLTTLVVPVFYSAFDDAREAFAAATAAAMRRGKNASATPVEG